MAGSKSRSRQKGKMRCVAYRANRTREKNKIRRLERHLIQIPGDKDARKALSLTKARL